MPANGEVLAAISEVYKKVDSSGQRIHKRLDDMVVEQSTMKTDIAVLTERVPEVPCDLGLRNSQRITHHVEESNAEKTENRRLMKRGVFSVVTAIVVAIILGLLAYFNWPGM